MKIKRDELWGYLFIISMMAFYSMDGWTEVRNAFMYFGLMMGLVGIVFSIKMKISTFLLYVAFSIIPVISYLHAHDTRILVLLVAMLCGITLEIQPMIMLMLYTKFACFIIMILSGGYTHINHVAVHGGILIMLYVCRYDQINVNQVLGILMAYVVLSVYTASGAFVICAGVGIGLLLLFERFGIKKVMDNFVVQFIFCICLFFNYFFAAGVWEKEIPYIGKWFPKYINELYINMVKFLDQVMNSRLTLTKYSWIKFGVSFWGGNVDYSQLQLGEGGYFNLDSGLIWLIQGGGILLTIGYMILTVVLIRYLRKYRQYHFLIAAIVIALWTINEDVLLGIGTNFLTILMGKAVVDWIVERKQQSDEYT